MQDSEQTFGVCVVSGTVLNGLKNASAQMIVLSVTMERILLEIKREKVGYYLSYPNLR